MLFERFKYEEAQRRAFGIVLRMEGNLERWRRYRLRESKTGELSDKDRRGEESRQQMTQDLKASLEAMHDYIKLLEHQAHEYKHEAMKERAKREAIEAKLDNAALIEQIDKSAVMVATRLIGNRGAALVDMNKERRRAASIGRARRAQPKLF